MHYLMQPNNIFREQQIVVVPTAGWTQRTAADGSTYYVNDATQQTRSAAPVVFGRVTSRVAGEGSKDYLVDTGAAEPHVVNAGNIGMIAPICKGWAQSLRVLDMSCNRNWVPEELEAGLGRAIARMPALAELYLAGVPIAFVLREMHALSQSGVPLPPIVRLDVAGAIGQRTSEESALLPCVLAALKASLSKAGAYLRVSNCLLNATDFGNALAALAGVGCARGSDLQVAVPWSTSPELEMCIQKTTFQGGIYCCNVPVNVGAAVLRALAYNTSVARLDVHSLVPDGLGLAGQVTRGLAGPLLRKCAVAYCCFTHFTFYYCCFTHFTQALLGNARCPPCISRQQHHCKDLGYLGQSSVQQYQRYARWVSTVSPSLGPPHRLPPLHLRIPVLCGRRGQFHYCEGRRLVFV